MESSYTTYLFLVLLLLFLGFLFFLGGGGGRLLLLLGRFGFGNVGVHIHLFTDCLVPMITPSAVLILEEWKNAQWMNLQTMN